MVAMAGKYIVSVERSRLVLTHPMGMSFDLTQEDVLELAVLIRNWQEAMAVGPCKREPEAKPAGEN